MDLWDMADVIYKSGGYIGNIDGADCVVVSSQQAVRHIREKLGTGFDIYVIQRREGGETYITGENG